MNNLWSDLHIIFPSVLAGKNPGHKFTSVASLPRKSNRTRWKASEWLMNDDQKPSWTWTQDTASHGFAYSGQYTMHVKHKLNGVIVNLQELLVELQSFCIDKYWQGCLDKICSSNSEGSRQGYQRHHLPLIFPFGWPPVLEPELWQESAQGLVASPIAAFTSSHLKSFSRDWRTVVSTPTRGTTRKAAQSGFISKSKFLDRAFHTTDHYPR